MPSVLAMHSTSTSKSRPKKTNKRTVNLLQQNIAQNHRFQTSFNQSYMNNNSNAPPNTNGYYNHHNNNNNINGYYINGQTQYGHNNINNIRHNINNISNINHRKQKQHHNNNINSIPPNHLSHPSHCNEQQRSQTNHNKTQRTQRRERSNPTSEYSSKLTQDPNFLGGRSPFYETLSRHCVMPICQKQLINFQFNLPNNYVDQIKECYKQKTKNKQSKKKEKNTEERVLHIRLFDLTKGKHVDWSPELFILKINEKSVTIPELVKDKDKKKKLGQKAKGFQFVQPLDISKFAEERMDFEIACYKEIFHGAASIEIVNLLTVDQIAARVIERSDLAQRLQEIEHSHCQSPINYHQNKCAVCNKQESRTTQLSRCSRCKSTWYCSTKCQQENWDRHVLGCRPYEELSALRLSMTDPRYSKRNGKNKKNNQDIICDEIKVSIRDPLSLCRIKTPIRGIKCYHPQCVDLNTYLAYSHSTKHWQCPICMQPLLYKELCVDKNMLKIIKELDDDIDNVRLNPDDYSYKVVTLKEIQENDKKRSGAKKRKNNRKRKHNELLISLTPSSSSSSSSHKKKKKKKRKTCTNLNGKYLTTTTSRKSKKSSLQSEVIVID